MNKVLEEYYMRSISEWLKKMTDTVMEDKEVREKVRKLLRGEIKKIIFKFEVVGKE